MQELERVIGIAAEAKLTWKLGSMAEEASQTAIWDALRNGHRDAVYFVKALVARLAESGVRYEPPEAATEHKGATPSREGLSNNYSCHRALRGPVASRHEATGRRITYP